MDLTGKKFIVSYSGGKNCALAMFKAIEQGMIPVGIITTFNDSLNRSWFHGLPVEILEQVAASFNVPLYLVHTDGVEYRANFIEELKKIKKLGAEVCVFGDNNNPKHLNFGQTICLEAGLTAVFPLDKESHEDIVNDLLKNKFKVNVNIINKYRLDESILGKVLDQEMVEYFKKKNINVCGENSEYQTFVSDGPIFSSEVKFRYQQIIDNSPFLIKPIGCDIDG